MHLGQLLGTALALCLVSPLAVAHPTASNETDTVYDFGLFPAYRPRPQPRSQKTLLKRDDKPFYMRIMPLGASITFGIGSTDGNGYRKHLRDKLRSEGWPVNMVGSQPGGTMRDKDTEGYPGWRILEIHGAAKNAVRYLPNLVLINAGTNDCAQNYDTGNAGQRMDDMLSTLFNNIPDVTVILSTLLPNGDGNTYTCVKNVNAQYKNVVQSRKNAGYKIEVANMDDGFITLGDLNSDGVHPGDYGHAKMAAVWWDAFQKVQDGITAPGDNGQPDDKPSNTCDKVYGVSDGPHMTQSGSGWDDGAFQHVAEYQGTFHLPQTYHHVDNPIGTTGYYDNIFFAQMVSLATIPRGGELDDLVIADTDDSGRLTLKGFNNLRGDGSFSDGYDFDVHQDCPVEGIRFGDINNDGLDDFICVNSRGNLFLSLNRGGNPPNFDYVGLIFTAPDGYSPIQTWIADMDGDGRADVCLMASNGDLRCHRNGWVDEIPAYWQEFTRKNEPTFIHQDKGYGPGVRLADLNGDFRADWMWIADDGRIDTFINNRRQSNDLGIKPQWMNAGTTHIGMHEENARPRVRLARIYGTNHRDYVYLNKEVAPSSSSGGLQLKFDVWKEAGSGGTKLKGDGVMYCDIRGTGSDDYLWVFSTGKIEFYGNTHSRDPPRWDIGPRDLLNGALEGVSRRDIHCADWDADGFADILVTNAATGTITLWHNEYNTATGEFKFVNYGQVNGPATCTEGRGVGLTDQGIRFADIDGDGRADIMCLQKDGRIYGWLNTVDGKVYQNQIKFAEGKDRANLRFADVNGDGRADLLWVEKFDGTTSVWYNMGPTPAGGSTFTWARQGPLYAPVGYNGLCMNFPNLGGLGRADLHAVLPQTSQAYTWFNTCGNNGGGSSGDDDTMDATLPDYTTTPQDGYPCNDDVISSTMPSAQKWNTWGCPNAWDQAVARWRGESRHIYTFSEAMMYYLGGTQANFECGVDTTLNGCNPVSCQNDMTASSWLILNSMAALSSIMLQFTNVLTDSANGVNTEIVTTMVDTFAPKKELDDLELVSTILGYVSLGLSAVSGPFFSRVFSEAIRNGAEYATDAISTGGEIMDQILSEEEKRRDDEEEEMNKAGNLHDKIQTLYIAWRDSFHQMRHSVFDGANDDSSIGRLYEAIRYGTLGASEYTAIDEPTLRMHVDQVVYAYLIPEAWKLSGQVNHAFILDAEASCAEPHNLDFLTQETADATYVCYNDRKYYLVGLGADGADWCDLGGCRPNRFEILPGVDTFSGPPSDPLNHPSDYTWGAVSNETFVHGAVNSFNANNRKNGWGFNSFGRTGRDLFSIDAEAPGLVQLSVCTGTAAYEGWKGGDTSSPTFPC